LISPFRTLFNWPTVERYGWGAFPFAVGATGVVALILLVPAGMRAAEDASINPHRPAPAAGEPGRADLIY
jgi:hypothetical protein